jgi:hypothetical protein
MTLPGSAVIAPIAPTCTGSSTTPASVVGFGDLTAFFPRRLLGCRCRRPELNGRQRPTTPHPRSVSVSKVIFDMSMSLDGFIAAANRRPEEPLGKGGERLHE